MSRVGKAKKKRFKEYRKKELSVNPLPCTVALPVIFPGLNAAMKTMNSMEFFHVYAYLHSFWRH